MASQAPGPIGTSTLKRDPGAEQSPINGLVRPGHGDGLSQHLLGDKSPFLVPSY